MFCNKIPGMSMYFMQASQNGTLTVHYGRVQTETCRSMTAVLVLLVGAIYGGEVKAQVFPAVVDLSTLDGTDGFRLDGEGVDSGFSVSAAGDINSDGVDDLIIGSPAASPNGNSASGSSYVVFGRDTDSAGDFTTPVDITALDGTNGFRLDGEATFALSGEAVSAAGDINNDGIDDLIIGSSGAAPNGEDFAGSNYVVFGKDIQADGPFATPIQLGELDGIDGFRLNGESGHDQSGRSVSAAGDINGDGVDDVIVGANGADPNGSSSGSTYVVFGRDTSSAGNFPMAMNLGSLDGTNGFRLDGEAAGDDSGESVSAAGDVNGDGVGDLIIGASDASPNGTGFAGSSYVVFGKDTSSDGAFPTPIFLGDLDGTNGFRLDGEMAEDFSGASVNTAGDINGDGISDMIIGAPGADPNGNSSGSTYVVFGRDTESVGSYPIAMNLGGLDGTNGFRLDGEAAGDTSGESVSATGDVNDDGINDLIIGASDADNNGITSGSSYVLFGRDTASTGAFISSINLGSLGGTAGFRIDGESADDEAGNSVSGAADINGDGIDDLIIGAQLADSTYVVFGRAASLGLELSPDHLDFGDWPLGSVAPAEPVTASNTGDADIEVVALTLTGANSEDFVIVAEDCAGRVLSPSEFCELEIAFGPTAPGVRRAIAQIESNADASPDKLDLVGTNDVVFHDGFDSR